MRSEQGILGIGWRKTGMMKRYWSEFHTNMHSRHLDEMEEWYEFAKEMLDFWAPVYYPYFVNRTDEGFTYEDTLPEEDYRRDFGRLKDFLQGREDGFLLYPAYEWQGDGSDGDHNVFFEDFSQDIKMPLTYEELYASIGVGNRKAMAVPHHTGYQPGHRGKNWTSNREDFSPVMEIYSSHGSSEASDADIPLNVHIHMGPRAERGTFMWALRQGVRTGVIASGDNHVCPAISGNGFFAVLAEAYDRKAIFQAIRERHTYGVSRSRIQLDYTVNGQIMGSCVQGCGINRLRIHAAGSSAIDRIEVYRNGLYDRCYTHSGTWERDNPEGLIRFKFEVELGWGPDRRSFPETGEKDWSLEIHTPGTILDVEKLWTSPGARITQWTAQALRAEIVTRKSDQGNGKLSQKNHLTPNIQNQSMIIEMEAQMDASVIFIIDGKDFEVPVRKLLEEAVLIAQEEEAAALLADRYGFTEFYREDAWWHNAYKVLIHRAYPHRAYEVEVEDTLEGLESREDSFFVKVIQRNGDTAWSSPIWVRG